MQRSKPRVAETGLRQIPALSRLLSTRSVRALQRRYGESLTKRLLRHELDSLRGLIRRGELSAAEIRAAVSATSITRRAARAAAELLTPRPRPVLNATGVIVHTNLGRSILSEAAAQRVARTAAGYVDLEYDLDSGRRGSRLDQLAAPMEQLFPGQAFIVVNNNAAAVMLCLHALARRKEVVISRGELVEIGGSFRVPDILAASGARLREVGTTNRTRVGDYAAVLGPRSGLLLKVHTSNFRIVGFTEEPTIDALAKVARKHELPLVVDWGSGDLIDLAPLGIHDEIPIAELLERGADLVTFSGDKLLGGAQAGFVVGRPELIARLRKDPLARVCRLDRLMIAALHETLSAYVRGRAVEEVPTLRMLALTRDQIDRRARRVGREAARRVGNRAVFRVIDGISRTGGGSSPTGERPTRLLAVQLAAGDAGSLERTLRAGDPAVIGRLHEGRLLLDLRTVDPAADEQLVERLVAALAPEN